MDVHGNQSVLTKNQLKIDDSHTKIGYIESNPSHDNLWAYHL